jgi:hypothetical protein
MAQVAQAGRAYDRELRRRFGKASPSDEEVDHKDFHGRLVLLGTFEQLGNFRHNAFGAGR